MRTNHSTTLALTALLIGTTLLLPVGAIAATTLGSPLELSPLIEEALTQNPILQAARKHWEATREQIEQATVLPDPTFGVQLWNFPQNGNLATSPGRSQNTIYTLAQRFPFPGKLPLKGEVAGRAAAISEQTFRLQELDLIGRVKQTYAELFFANKDVEIHHEHVDVMKQLFATATARFRAGKGGQVDVLKAQVELSNLYQRLPVLDQQRRVAAAKLNTLLRSKGLKTIDAGAVVF